MRKKTLLILTKTTIITLALSMLVGCSHQQETNSVTTTPAPTTTLHTHSCTESIAEATCEKDGIKTFICACGNTYTEPIAKLGHDYDAVITAPTCTEAGFTTHTCKRCNHSYTDAETAAIGHTYDDGTITAEATSCSACGKTKTRIATGTKLVPETLWSDGYVKHVWHDMGGYMFWIGDTQEEANNMAFSNAIQSKADILSKSYPDRSVYNMSSHPNGVPIAFTSTKIDVPSWRPTFIWNGGSADANANEPTQLESFDPIHAEGLPFVPFQIYDEGDMVYYWYPAGSFYGYGKFTEQDNAAKYECYRIISERYNINRTESKPFYEKYYYKCSLGNHNIDGEKYILYYKSITYVPGTH